MTRGINEPEELINIVMEGRAPICHAAGGAAPAAAEQGEGVGRQIYKHLMNGVSHMLPFVVGGGIITEGAIPFAASDPLRVLPACILGSATAGGLSMLLGCASPAPHGGAWVIAVITNPVQYLLALAAGAVVGCLVLALLKKPLPPEQSGLAK